MRLENLKKRTLEILSCVDENHFKPAIQLISQIHATDRSNFADIYAKASLLKIALSGLVDGSYLANLNDNRKVFLLTLLYNDQQISLDLKAKILSNRAAASEVPTSSNPTESMREYVKVLDTFLAKAEDLRKVYHTRGSSSQLRELNKTINRMQIDADVDSNEETTTLKQDTVIGTTGVGSCKAIIFTGKNRRDKTFVSVGHFSTLDNEMIVNIRKDFVSENKILKNSLQAYLIGGCIENFPENLELIMQLDLGLVDFRICTNEGENEAESSSVIISGQYPNEIFYSESDLSHFYPAVTLNEESANEMEEAHEADTISDEALFPASSAHFSSSSSSSSSSSFFSQTIVNETAPSVVKNDLSFLEWMAAKGMKSS